MDWVLALVLDQLSGVPEVVGLDVQELTPQGSVLEVVSGHALPSMRAVSFTSGRRTVSSQRLRPKARTRCCFR